MGYGLWVMGYGLWVIGNGFRISNSGFRVWGSRFRVWGSRSRVWGRLGLHVPYVRLSNLFEAVGVNVEAWHSMVATWLLHTPPPPSPNPVTCFHTSENRVTGGVGGVREQTGTFPQAPSACSVMHCTACSR
jgi:hypothetical protein